MPSRSPSVGEQQSSERHKNIGIEFGRIEKGLA